MEIKVASFNVKGLSVNNETAIKKRDIKAMADCIREYDIVALQEMRFPKFRTKSYIASPREMPLLFELGSYWRGKMVYYESDRNDETYEIDPRHEGFAFLWNTRKVDLAEDESDDSLTHNYKPGVDGITLKRDPAYARFKLKRRPVEIRVINVHIISKEPSENSIRTPVNFGDLNEMRNREFDIIAGQIYKQINDAKLHKGNAHAYTIIIGDYNLNLEGHGVDKECLPQIRYYNRHGEREYGSVNVIKTVQEERTTIKKEGDGYTNNFDHCSYNVDKTEHVISQYGRSTCLNDKTPEEIKQFRDTVSDHVPIFVTIIC